MHERPLGYAVEQQRQVIALAAADREGYSMGTAMHEAASAATMLTPSLTLLLSSSCHLSRPCGATILLACMLLHLPVGVGYHAGAALGLYRCRLDNAMRKLDQTLQHLISIVFSYVLSGSVPYAAAVSAPPNLYWAWQVWQPGREKCWRFVGCSVALYTLPMLVWRRDAASYAVAVVSIALGGAAAFVWKNPWGHAVFHLLLGVHAEALARCCCRCC